MRFSGEKLRELRKARRWDQHRLAEVARQHATGITQTSVSRHENGMQPSARNAMAYAKALGVDPSTLFELDDDEEEAASMGVSHESEVESVFRAMIREEIAKVVTS